MKQEMKHDESSAAAPGLAIAQERGIAIRDIGSRVIAENDLTRVWELALAPGAQSDFHLHRHPYLLIMVSGGEWEVETIFGELTSVRAEPGDTLTCERRTPVERIINRSDKPWVARVVEMKSVRWVFDGDLPPAEPGAVEGNQGLAAAFKEVLINTAERDWEPKSLPGLSQKMLWRNEESGASIALIRFEKGSGIPNAHAHASNQFMYCLSGQFRYIPTGTTLVPGSFYCNPEGSVHGPTVADETTVFLEIYDGPHYPVQPPWYTNEEDAR